MAEAAAVVPRVSVKGAFYQWKISDGFWQNGNRRREGDAQRWKEFDEQFYCEAEAKLQAAFDQLLDIPKENTAELTVFFKENEDIIITYRLPLPESLRLFAPYLFDNHHHTWNQIAVGIHWGSLKINEAAMQAIYERLCATIPVYIYPTTLFVEDRATTFLRLCNTFVRQCVAFVRKILAFLQRGVAPPQRLLESVFRCFTVLEQSQSWWMAWMCMMVMWGLAKDGYSCIQYGPKPNDFYHSPPAEYEQGWPIDDDVGIDGCTVCLHATGITLDFEYVNTDSLSGIIAVCRVRQETMRAALEHITAAKVIAKRTGLEENACRQMWRHEAW